MSSVKSRLVSGQKLEWQIWEIMRLQNVQYHCNLHNF